MGSSDPSAAGGKRARDSATEESRRHEQRAAENREERELLRRFREQGDVAAFDELVRRTEGRVRAVALAVLRDPAGAEDAAQDAFLRAFRRAGSYRDEGPVAAWLCRIAVRCAHDRIRKAERRRRLAEAVRPAAATGPESFDGASYDEAASLGIRAEMESALRSLPPAEREALVLKEVAGMTYREISASSGVPLGTVQSRIHRARLRLAEVLSRRTGR